MIAIGLIRRTCLKRPGWAAVAGLAAALGGAATGALGQTPPTRADADDRDLAERLIRKAVTDSDEDLMAGVIRTMNESARRLEIEFDAGEETQAVQRRIIEQLDEAIKAAASRIRPQMRRDQPTTGDKRRRPPGSRSPLKKPADGKEGEAEASSATTAGEKGTAVEGPQADRDLRESRRGWGNLPQREREEVLQGADEEFLERYREWIEQYYRALQEAED